MWHLSTQVNDGDIDVLITVFDPRRGNHRRFIPFPVYDFASNLVTLATISPWSEYVCTYTCSHFLSKPLLMWHRTVETGLLINW